MSMFKKAERRGQKIKFAVTGPSGSGKTTAAIKLARGLVGENGRIAIIDTENGSASLYADLDDFDACNLEPPYEQQRFSEAIKDAEDANYDVLVIDSFSHVWEAILTFKDKLDNRGGNSFTNWNKASQQFKSVLDAILHARMHVICCMRAKMEHVIQEDGGRRTVKKVGLAPIMRDGIEFEFTTVFDLDMQHFASASKDRTRLFDGQIKMLDKGVGNQLREWLEGAAEEETPSATVQAPEANPEPIAPCSEEQALEIENLWKILEKSEAAKVEAFKHLKAHDVKKWEDLNEVQALALIKILSAQRDMQHAAVTGGRTRD